MKNIYVYGCKMYKLKNWVDDEQLTVTLSSNERAAEYLECHEHLIDDHAIFENEHAFHIAVKRIKRKNYDNLNYNKNAVNFLRNNRKYINYGVMCGQEYGIEFVEESIKNNTWNRINWILLSRNPAAMHILNRRKYRKCLVWIGIIHNKNAVELVRNNLHMVENYWNYICEQAHLIDMIDQNRDKIDWRALSINDKAIHILEQNLENVNITQLCKNKNGFHLLLQLNHVFRNSNNYHKNIVFEYFDYCQKNNKQFNLISQLSKYGYTENHMEFLKHNNDYDYLSMNSNIFEYDYKRMRETRQALLWYNDIKK
jgi:hypothetical protein